MAGTKGPRSKSKSPSSQPTPSSTAKKRVNSFDEHANRKTTRHPALNRKIKGSARNVGQARSRAKEERENLLLKQYEQKRRTNAVVDKRLVGEAGLSKEEKLLKRFQVVRSKKRAGKFHLGDDAENVLEEDEGLTHQGKSLKEVLDEENEIVEEESEDDEDVDDLVQRLKNGEALHEVSSSNGKQPLTKREAMLDVVKKSKILKMERQREKEDDEEERDRLDALMKDVVVGGGLQFRPTGEAAKFALKEDNNKASSTDEYERMVRELQMDGGPRAAATERTKSAEEIARDEVEELERQEKARLKRMDNGELDDDDDDDDALADEGDNDEDEDDNKRTRRSKKQRKTKSIEEDDNELLDNSDISVPFVIECPRTHMEFLEFLHAYPDADLNIVIHRIRKGTSIHLKAENRQRLAKFVDILIDHLSLLAEKHSQLATARSKSSVVDIGSIIHHLHGIARDVPTESSISFFNRLELNRRTFENHLAKASSVHGGDYGEAQAEFAKPAVEKRLPGGHKDGLAEALNAEAAKLAQLRGDAELASSSTRCWPSCGDFAFYASIVEIFSTTDQRHPIVSTATLLLGRILTECPIRGPRDVVAAIQTAQILEKMIRRNESNANRYSPEVFLLVRVVLSQLNKPIVQNDEENGVVGSRLFRLDSFHTMSQFAFNFLREALKSEFDLSSKKADVFRGVFAYSKVSASSIPKEVSLACLHSIGELIELGTKAVEITPSADILLSDWIAVVKALQGKPNKNFIFQKELEYMEKISAQTIARRNPLRLQEFAPEFNSLTPRFLEDSLTASKRPGDETRKLKKQVKQERKTVQRELRLDGQFLAEVRNRKKSTQLQELRAKRHQNFAELEGQQAQFNQLVRDGFAIKGAGVGGLSLKGRKMGKRSLDQQPE